MLYLLLVGIKGGYRVHSVHKDHAAAESWRRCKEHDGEDMSIAEIGEDEVNAIAELSETKTE